jgi:hypothetical protein
MKKNGQLYSEDYDAEGYPVIKRYSITWAELKNKSNKH